MSQQDFRTEVALCLRPEESRFLGPEEEGPGLAYQILAEPGNSDSAWLLVRDRRREAVELAAKLCEVKEEEKAAEILERGKMKKKAEESRRRAEALRAELPTIPPLGGYARVSYIHPENGRGEEGEMKFPEFILEDAGGTKSAPPFWLARFYMPEGGKSHFAPLGHGRSWICPWQIGSFRHSRYARVVVGMGVLHRHVSDETGRPGAWIAELKGGHVVEEFFLSSDYTPNLAVAEAMMECVHRQNGNNGGKAVEVETALVGSTNSEE